MDLKATFETFVTAPDIAQTIHSFQTLAQDTSPYTYDNFKNVIIPHLNYRQKTLFTVLDLKYNGSSHLRSRIQPGKSLAISGAGPCGLRAAVEAALAGLKVRVIELRNVCTRHNVLKVWQNSVDDLYFWSINFLPVIQITRKSPYWYAGLAGLF